ncbi:hypothetical protein BDB00DRAFT_871063 [Zychaea mexicana]|uniref:uncharacterized protein n=1 Tax=Zychaea mexicana TaxID=64656 RepID=UPI0022FE6BDF|nr:uncharacterized protein BDB00DRAFT_871063 [Zychaea mexicana]KAI9494788.1 hypothetical protein BDB00DRAFT_871063 [Zychaea mexicana]
MPLSKTTHEELSDETCDILNQDWLQYPQLRYCTSQLLAGAIVVEEGVAIIIDTIEPYARDTLLDAHHERRLFGSASSFPSVPASLRLDSISVNLGPTTSHFAPSQNTRVSLDSHLLELANHIPTNPITMCRSSSNFASALTQPVTIWTMCNSIDPDTYNRERE